MADLAGHTDIIKMSNFQKLVLWNINQEDCTLNVKLVSSMK